MATNALGAYATYGDNVRLDEVLQALGRAGFDKESVCLLLSPTHPIATIVRESSTRLFDHQASVVSAGLMNWLSELGAVVIPTFGFFVRSPKFFRALLTQPDFVSACGQRGTLISLGFSEEDAERYQDHVREVGVLVYVASSESAKTRWALELLRATGAEEAGLVDRVENEDLVGAVA